MIPVLPIAAALGLALVAMSRGKGPDNDNGEIPDPVPDPGKSPIETAQRIAREATEIIAGKRDDFSDDGNEATKKAIMGKLLSPADMPGAGGLRDASALKAAQLAKGKSNSLPPKPATAGAMPRPVPTPRIKAPIAPIARPVAVKPRPLPIGTGGPYTASPASKVPMPAGGGGASGSWSPTPEGLDRASAAKNAPAVSANIRAKKYDYNRPALKIWQRQAGIAQDGLYGPQTAATLKTYDKNAPAALFKKG